MKFNLFGLLSRSQNALKGYINFEELLKAVLTALGAGAGLAGVLTALYNSLGTIITDPALVDQIHTLVGYGLSRNWLALVGAILVLVADLTRRFNQGAVLLAPPPPKEAVGLYNLPVVAEGAEDQVLSS